MKSKLLVPNDGEGKELVDLLIKKLGIPPYVTDFNVIVEMGNAIKVSCTYYPSTENDE